MRQEIYDYLTTHHIRHLLLDSRQLLQASETAFFALPGTRMDGHDFIPDLYRKGVRCFVVQQKMNGAAFPGAVFFTVENTLGMLQGIVALHRHRFHIPVIGITGSNGKTIVKEWLCQLLDGTLEVVSSPQSYNSQTGVPLSVWGMEERHDLGIFEAGISQKGEMGRIAPIIDCDVGIFTSLGTAHDAGFESKRQKAEEKSLLFKKAGKVIIPKDAKLVNEALEAYGTRKITWSFQQEADLHILSTTPDGSGGLELRGRYKHGNIRISIPFMDDVSTKNAVICWLTLLEMGYGNTWIDERMRQLRPVAMRLELKKGVNHNLLINDTYNLDLTSLRSSLQFMELQAANMPKNLILSDILQHGGDIRETYLKLSEWLNDDFATNRVIGIGSEIGILDDFLTERIDRYFYRDTDAFLKNMQKFNFRDEAILVKGAREFRFERIAARLEAQAHRTVLEVDLAALEHNYRIYKKQLRPNVKLMAMVKASAYGAGAVEVSRLLENRKVDYLAVAYVDEGVALRRAGIQTPILVLNVEDAGFDALLRHGLEPEIYSLEQLRKFHRFLRGKRTRVKIHLKLDTGMKRLGFEETEIDALVHFFQENTNAPWRIQSIFSHLSASDASAHDPFTNRQVRRFQNMYDRISTALGIRPLRHILNSAGILRFPGHQLDMVRLGLGLYGISGTAEIQSQLQVVACLKARISQIKHLAAGESVGYNRGGKATGTTRIATISIGYADGLPRRLGLGRYALRIRDANAPIIGVVCMDMCMVDISHIPDARVGDEVVVFGEAPSIQNMAEALGTIPYEVFTGISDRVKRVYLWA